MRFVQSMLCVMFSTLVCAASIAWGEAPQDDVTSLPPLSEPIDLPEVSLDGGATCDCGCSCGDCCCRMEEVCCRTMEKETAEKHCWKVGCEKVCIPPICLPKCCRLLPFGFCRSCADCGIRCVNTLEKHTYECTECNCKWEVRCVPACDCGCCGCAGTCWASTGPAITEADFAASMPPASQPTSDENAKAPEPDTTVTVAFEQPAKPPSDDSAQHERAHRLWSWARVGILSGQEPKPAPSAE